MSHLICKQFKLRGCPCPAPVLKDDCDGWISFSGGEINAPGRYCLNRNLTTTSGTPAIEINSGNVVLNLNTKTITLRDDADVGVRVNDSTNVAILNGIIETEDDIQSGTECGEDEVSNTGIELLGSKSVLLDDLNLIRLGYGVFASGVDGVHVKDTYVLVEPEGNLANATLSFVSQHLLGPPAAETPSMNILLENLNLHATADAFCIAGLNFGGSGDELQVKNVILKNIKAFNVDLLVRNGSSFVIEDSEFLVEDPLYPFSVAQFGAVTGDNPNMADNILVSNSTFINKLADTSGASGVSIVWGYNMKFYDVTIESTTTVPLTGFTADGEDIDFDPSLGIGDLPAGFDILSGLQTSTVTIGVDARFGVLFPDSEFNDQAFGQNIKFSNAIIKGDTLLPAFYSSNNPDVVAPVLITDVQTAPFPNDGIWLEDSLVYDSTACMVTTAPTVPPSTPPFVQRFGVFGGCAVVLRTPGTVDSLASDNLVHGGLVCNEGNDVVAEDAYGNVAYGCPHGGFVPEEALEVV